MQQDTKRSTITLTREAVDALKVLTSERKQGEYISKLVMDALTGRNQQASQPGILERIEGKLDKVLSGRGVN